MLGWRPGQWFTAVEVVLLPVVGVAVLRQPGTGLRDLFGAFLVLVPVVMFAPWWPRHASEHAFRSLALPGILIAVAAAMLNLLPLPIAAADTCGAARIEVDQELLPAVQVLFALEADGTCTDAVEFSALRRGDPHTALRAPQAPIAGVITADPAIVQGLGGGWGDLTVDPAAPEDWHLLGRMPATVFLDDGGYRTRRSVSLAELAKKHVRLDVRDITPPDPVSAAVLSTSPRPEIGVRPVDLTDPRSCLNVVLPAGLDSACADGAAGTELRLEDGKGNTVGAAVLAIPLTAEAQRASADAAHAFLSGLDRAEAREALNLVDATATTRDVLRQSAAQAPAKPALDLTIVLDSSQSMGITERGAPARWTAAREGVLRWAARKPLDQTDRLTVVPAHTGDGLIRDHTVSVSGNGLSGLELLGLRVGGQTGLAEALRARPPALPGARPVLVLLTDGVNALTEQPVARSARAGLEVVVIGGACGRLPGWAREHCHSTDSNSGHIADQLTTLAEEP
jgi:hypothetical protein